MAHFMAEVEAEAEQGAGGDDSSQQMPRVQAVSGQRNHMINDEVREERACWMLRQAELNIAVLSARMA
ncbi:MAG: hypothetical protein V4730_06170 [Pseudomonadota bacterium]